MHRNDDYAALEHIYEQASQHTVRIPPQMDYTSPVVAVVAFTIFACLAWPLFSDPDNFRKFVHALRDMASRASLGILKRPLPGADSGALSSVFGLKNGGLKNLGTDTLQRGFGGIRSMVKGGSASAGDAPAGLGNWDNSCYQNSVIQGLASIRSLPDFLRRVAGKSGGASMNEALLETMGRLNDVQNSGRALWLPQELKTMSTWQQQDAQEYFSKILDKLDKEAIKVAKLEAETKYDLSLKETRKRLGEETAQKEAARLRNPLDGLMAQRVGCKTCGHSDGISLIPFNCLTVPLGRESHYDIRDCLDEYTALEEIDGVQCPKCTLLAFQTKLKAMVTAAKSSEALQQHIQQRLQAVEDALDNDDFSDHAITKKCQIPKKQWVESTKTKQAVVARAPGGLVVHVNRSMFNEYTGAQIKNPAVVQFPPRFGLGQWMLGSIHEASSSSSSPSSNDDANAEEEECWSMDPQKSMLPLIGEPVASDAQYELRAVVTHFGRHENGHYVCYRQHPRASDADTKEESQTWWRLSDEDVTRVDQDFVLRQGGVFMLFYEKIDELPVERGIYEGGVVAMEAVSATEAASIPLPADDDEEWDAGEFTQDSPVESSLTAPSLEEQLPIKLPRQLPTPPESVAESDLDSITDDSSISTTTASAVRDYAHEPVQAIRMRTSNVFADDKNRGSSESLLMGNRMVSAS